MILGNGSDELIQAIILAFGGPVLVPVPTFAMYEITSRALAQEVVTVPLDEDFDLDADAVVRQAKQSKARVIFLACSEQSHGQPVLGQGRPEGPGEGRGRRRHRRGLLQLLRQDLAAAA